MLKIVSLFLFTLLPFTVFAEGLKKVNYQDKTIETKETSASSGASGLSPEDTKKLMEDVEKIKKNQAEAQKYLEELENEP